MSTKKIIQINPELFRLSGNKTRKTRDKKELTLTPIVKPNVIRNNLLKRIKEHKTNEINANKNTSNNKHASSSNVNTGPGTSPNKSTYSDEFYSAIDYLSDLTKKNKRDVEKEKYQNNLNNRTMKNYVSSTPTIQSQPIQTTHSNPSINNQYTPLLSSMTSSSPYVELDLPFDLQEPTPIQSSFFTPSGGNVMDIKYKKDADVPYGCLKGGNKPSYRSWIQTRKNYDQVSSTPDIAVRPPTPPKKNTFVNITNPMPSSITPTTPTPTLTDSREHRLEQIKHKLKKIQEQENGSKPEYKALGSNLAMLEQFAPEGALGVATTKMTLDPLTPFEDENNKADKIIITDIATLKEAAKIPTANPELKKYIKRTIRRKFTLGRSDKLRKVGILLKDKQTRKNVINAQKELKKTNITDVRKYLRQHGIIKVGTTAPNDILRKTFESAMLAGEITNMNKDVLLHNFLNEEV
jgi:hypothetical protein